MYEDYLKKVDEILPRLYGAGTLAYRNTNRETMVLSLIMLDLIEEIKAIKDINKSEKPSNTQGTKKSSKKD